MVIAIDFDGTIVEHKYPAMGKEIPFAIETLKKLRNERHQLVLWTVREGYLLEEALDFCHKRGLEFYSINQDYPEEERGRGTHFSRKIKADLFIDDRNLGGLPDWGIIYEMVNKRMSYLDLMRIYGGDRGRGKRKSIFSRLFLLLLALPLLMTGCTSYKSVPYLQKPREVYADEKTIPLFDAKIMPKDLLSITVNTTDPKASAPFNLTVQSPLNASFASLNTTTQPALQQYLVNNSGEIDFPAVGTLRVVGFTKGEAEALIRERLKPYLKEEPIVTVRMLNYKISVLGEVTRPGCFTISNEKVNVLEALALAGDMTIYGVRNDVKLIREDMTGKRQIIRLDLNNADILLSPYYYLTQNDILYVTPNKTKARNSDIGNSTTLWVSATSILVSIASLLVNVLR